MRQVFSGGFFLFFLLHDITKNLPPFQGVSWWSKGWETCGAAGFSFVLRGKTTLIFPFDSLFQSNKSSRGGEGRGACGHVRGVLEGEEEGSVVWGVCWRSIWSTESARKNHQPNLVRKHVEKTCENCDLNMFSQNYKSVGHMLLHVVPFHCMLKNMFEGPCST